MKTLFYLFIAAGLPPLAIGLYSGSIANKAFYINTVLVISSVLVFFLFMAGLGIILYAFAIFHGILSVVYQFYLDNQK